MHRRVEREVQRSGADATGQRAAKGFLEIPAAERQQGFGIREKEARGQLVLSAAEFAIPIGGELIISVLPWPADCKRNGIAGSQSFAPAGTFVGAGKRDPPVFPPNLALLKFKSLNNAGSMLGGLQFPLEPGTPE